MKKSLSAILAASMAFSMFASAAFAADDVKLDTEGKFQAMKEAGIFQGYPDGKSHLEANMTRAEFAKALAALLGLEDDAAAAKVYSDVAANHWAIGEIGALTAEEIMNGTGAGKFGPKVNVSIEQLAKIVVGAMGLEPKEDAEVEGKTSVWATGYVAAAVEAGLIAKSADYTVLANRGDLVDASYTVFEAGQEAQITVKDVKVIDEKNIEVFFSDDKSVKKTLDTALVEGAETTVSVEYNGKKYDVKVTLLALAAESKIAGAKTIEVKFNRAVDTAKAKIEVFKNGSAVAIDSTKYTDDKTSATVVLTNNLFAGDYEVRVSGVTTEPLKQTIKAENEKIAKIEYLSDTLAVNDALNEVIVSYKVTNQYGEDITSTTSGIDWTASKGVTSVNNGKVKISVASPATYQIGENVVLAGVHSSSNTVLSASLKVGQKSMVDTVEVVGIYNIDKKELSTASDYGQFYILVNAKDQYGNSVDAAKFNSDVVVVPSNAGIFQTEAAVDNQGEKNNQIGIPLKNTLSYKLDGTNTINFITKLSTKSVKYDVVVKKASAVDNIVLSTPNASVAVGEKVRIPFTANDQYGNALTKIADLQSVTLTGATWKNDLKEGKAYIEYEAPATPGTHVVFAMTPTGKSSQINIEVKAAAYANKVTAVKGLTLNFLPGATQEIKAENITVLDQHGRAMDLANIGLGATDGKYQLKFDKVSTTGAVTGYDGEIFDATGDKFTVEAEKTGTETIKVTLQKVTLPAGGTASYTDVSSFNFSLSVIGKADVSEYVVEDTGKIFNQEAGVTADVKWNKSVSVYGKKLDGTKVLVPASDYVVNPVSNVALAADGKLTAVGTTVGQSDTDSIYEVTGSYVVIVDGANGPQTINKEIIVSDAAPKATAIADTVSAGGLTVDGNLITGAVADITPAKLFALLSFNDQYGVGIAGNVASSAYFSITGPVNNAGAVWTVTNNGQFAGNVVINGLDSKDSFTLTVRTVGGASKEYKVVAN